MDTDEIAGREPGPAVTYPDLRGRVAIVTGAAKGIGRGVAERLAAEGMRLTLVDIDVTELERTARRLGDGGSDVIAPVADLVVDDDVDRVFTSTLDEFGAIDLLVNNAAVLERRRVFDDQLALIDLELAANVRAPYLCALRAARAMRVGGGGSIVNLSSVGALRAHHRGLPYDMTKGAIDAMTRAMAIELGEHDIRVNAVAPGVTHTYRTDRHAGSPGYRATEERIPLRRFGTVDDVAAAVAFLASSESSYITGQVLYVDGGITAQLSPTGPGALEQLDGATSQPTSDPRTGS